MSGYFVIDLSVMENTGFILPVPLKCKWEFLNIFIVVSDELSFFYIVATVEVRSDGLYLKSECNMQWTNKMFAFYSWSIRN